jgi:hypothetical protein
MNLRLLFGIAIFLVGIIATLMGIAQVGRVDTEPPPAVAAEEEPFVLDKLIIPGIAGVSLAVGGLLIGLGIGNWKHPRTHLQPGDQVVDPEGYHKMKHV